MIEIISKTRYGDGPTVLKLSEKAQRIYNVTDPLDIYEYTFIDDDGLGGTYWTAHGAIEFETDEPYMVSAEIEALENE